MNSYKLLFDGLSGLFLLLTITYLQRSSLETAFYLTAVLVYFAILLFADFIHKNRFIVKFILCLAVFSIGLIALPYLLLLFPSTLFTFLFEGNGFSFGKLSMLVLLGLTPLLIEQETWFRLAYLFLLGATALFDGILVREGTRQQTMAAESELLRIQVGKLQDKLARLETQSLEERHLVQLEERNALSHRIHDELGHSLSGGLIQLEAAKAILYRDTKKAEELLVNAIKINQVGIDEIRHTLKSIKPPQESLGITRLKQKITQFETEYQFRTFFQTKGMLEKITQPMWYCLERNLLEALTNILKHSDAEQVTVSLVVLNKFIRFEVKDDGTALSEFVKSLGLIGMEERTAQFGGHVTFHAEDGFSVTTIIPIS